MFRGVKNRRLIRPNDRTVFPKRLAFLDTEAFRYDRGDHEEQTFRLGVVLFITIDEGLNVTSHSWIVAKDTGELWREINSLAMRYNSITLFAHNAGYDLQLSNAFVELDNLGWRVDTIYDDNGNTYVEWRKGHRVIRAVDSFFILRGSIAELGQLLGIGKLNMPGDEESDDAWVSYCARDVLILAASIYNWLRFIREHDLGSFRYTLAGQALQAFRHRFMSEKIYATRDEEVLNLELQAYRGGRSEAFLIGEVKGMKLYKLDVNSMYPYVMAAFPHPVSALWILERPSVSKLRYLSRNAWLLVDAYVDTSEPAYGVRRNGKLVFPVGRFRAILCGEEVRYALAHGHIRKAERAVVYKAGKPFTNYVNYFYELRQEAKAIGDVVLERNCKLMLNALYGKFGQKGRKEEVIGEGEDFGYGYDSLVFSDAGHKGILRRLGHIAIASYEDGVAWYAFPALAASITAAARMYLWSLIKRAGRSHVYYCDTDSLIVDKVGLKRLRPFLSDHQLGLLKLEQTASYLRINTVKDYELGDEKKSKGVGKVVGILDDGNYVVERWERLRGAMRQGITGVVRVFRRPWRRICVYDKGVVEESGRVKPLRLDEY